MSPITVVTPSRAWQTTNGPPLGFISDVLLPSLKQLFLFFFFCFLFRFRWKRTYYISMEITRRCRRHRFPHPSPIHPPHRSYCSPPRPRRSRHCHLSRQRQCCHPRHRRRHHLPFPVSTTKVGERRRIRPVHGPASWPTTPVTSCTRPSAPSTSRCSWCCSSTGGFTGPPSGPPAPSIRDSGPPKVSAVERVCLTARELSKSNPNGQSLLLRLCF